MKLGYIYGGKIKGGIDLGTDPYTGLALTFKGGGLDIDGPADIYCIAGQRLNVEKEGGINEEYWAAKFKATSVDALALVNQWMCGVLAEAALTEGTFGGGLGRLSGLHAFLTQAVDLDDGAISAVVTAQVASGTTKIVNAGVEVLVSGGSVDKMLSLRGGGINSVLGFTDVIANVVDYTEAGTSGSMAGYLKVRFRKPGGAITDRWLRLYDAQN